MAKTAKPDFETKHTLRGVRLLWPAFYELPVINDQKQDKYSTKAILSPVDDAAALAALATDLRKLSMHHFGHQKLDTVKNLCLRKLNYEGLEDEDDLMELMLKTKVKPIVVGPDLSPISAEEDGNGSRVYSGVRANIQLSLWGVKNGYGETLGAQLDAVQIVRDDTPLVGGRMSLEKAVAGFEAANDGFGGDDSIDALLG